MSDQEQDRREKKLPYESEAILIEGRVENLEREQREEKERDREYKKRQLSFNKLLAWFTGGLLFTSLISDGIYMYLARSAKKTAEAAKISADAAKSASDTATRQLEIIDRPWLKVSFTPYDITFRDGGMQLGVIPHITNTGHSAATGVVIPIKIFLPSSADDFFKEPLRRQKALCDPLDNVPVGIEASEKEIAIFSNDTNSSLFLGAGFSRQEIDSSPTANPHFTNKHVAPILVGCVDYGYDASKRHHQTRFIYSVFQAGIHPNTTIEVGKDVSAKNVILVPYPFGGFMAN